MEMTQLLHSLDYKPSVVNADVLLLSACDWSLFFLLFFHPSMHDQLSHPDCDSRTSGQGENLYLQEADPLSELDRSAHQRYDSAQD